MTFERMARLYDVGRTPTDVTLSRWRAVLAPYLGIPKGSRTRDPLVDVGAGTGLWAEAIGLWFDPPVVAVEPSAAIRREGTIRRGATARWVGGTADRLPLRDAACRAAWLSSVIHPVEDLEAAGRELRRVVREGGPVLIRNGFPGPLRDRDPLYRFFPAARRFADTFLCIDRLAEAFVTGDSPSASTESSTSGGLRAPRLHESRSDASRQHAGAALG